MARNMNEKGTQKKIMWVAVNCALLTKMEGNPKLSSV